MFASYLGGLMAGLAVAIPVGAIATLLVTISAHNGWKVGVSGSLGTATVDGVYATGAVLAGSAVAPVLLHWQEPLRWASAVVLAVVGVWLMAPAWKPARTTDDDRRISSTRAYWTILGLTAVNPATLIYFAALVAGRPFGDLSSWNTQVAFVLGVFSGSAGWGAILTSVGAAAGRWLTSPGGRRWTAIVGGGLVIGLAVRTLLV